MPTVAVVTIVLALVAAVALASAVAVIAVELGQTSAALARVDRAFAVLPPALAPLDATMTDVNDSLAAVAAVAARDR